MRAGATAVHGLVHQRRGIDRCCVRVLFEIGRRAKSMTRWQKIVPSYIKHRFNLPKIFLEGRVVERSGRRFSYSLRCRGQNGLGADSRNNKWSKKFLQRCIVPVKGSNCICCVFSDVG